MAERIEITDGLENVVGGTFSTIKDKVNGGYKTKAGYSGRKFYLLNGDKLDELNELLMDYPNTAEGESAAIEAALKAGIFDHEL